VHTERLIESLGAHTSALLLVTDLEAGVETETLAEVEAEGEAGILVGWAGPIT